jgi:hypothetical protein
MTAMAPIAEQRFLLRHVAGIHQLIGPTRFAAIDADVIEAVVKCGQARLLDAGRRRKWLIVRLCKLTAGGQFSMPVHSRTRRSHTGSLEPVAPPDLKDQRRRRFAPFQSRLSLFRSNPFGSKTPPIQRTMS